MVKQGCRRGQTNSKVILLNLIHVEEHSGSISYMARETPSVSPTTARWARTHDTPRHPRPQRKKSKQAARREQPWLRLTILTMIHTKANVVRACRAGDAPRALLVLYTFTFRYSDQSTRSKISLKRQVCGTHGGTVAQPVESWPAAQPHPPTAHHDYVWG